MHKVVEQLKPRNVADDLFFYIALKVLARRTNASASDLGFIICGLYFFIFFISAGES